MEEEPVTHDQLEEHCDLLTVEETSDYLGLARREAYELVLSGGIESMGVGTRRLIAPAAIAGHLQHLGEASLTKSLLRVLRAGALPTVLKGGLPFVSVEALLRILESPAMRTFRHDSEHDQWRRNVMSQASAQLGVSIRTLRRRIATGDLPAYRSGRRILRVRGTDLDRIFRRVPTRGL